MPLPLSKILTCSIAPDVFQPTGYGKTIKGVYNEDGDRYADEIVLTITGEVIAAGAASLAAAVAAFDAAVADADAHDVSITSGATTLESIDAGACTDGPKTSLSYGARTSLTQDATVTIAATRLQDPEEPVVEATRALRVTLNVEGLATHRWSGTFTTRAGESATTQFRAVEWPATPVGWQDTNDSYQTNQPDDTQCTWEVTHVELAEAYPVVAGGAPIVDGEYTATTDTDAHNREITRHNYRYVGPGAEVFLNARHAALVANGGLTRASIAVTTHKTRSATGTFEVLAAADGGQLLELVETVTHGGGQVLTAYTYPGTTPLLCRTALEPYRYTQSGRALGLMNHPKEPPPLFGAAALASEPEISLTRQNDNELVTTWRYEFLFADAQAVQLPSVRENSEGFYV